MRHPVSTGRAPGKARVLALLLGGLACAGLSGCPDKDEAPAVPTAETTSPADSPVPYKVLEDKTENSQVEFHVLIAPTVKHDDVQKLLGYLYRHLWTRGEDEPAAVAAYVYNSEAAFKTPPRTPIAQVVRKPGEVGPTMENKVPLEFGQLVELALSSDAEKKADKPRWDKGMPLGRKVQLDEAKKALTLTVPFAEPTQDGKGLEWVEAISFNQAMNNFTDAAISLFEGVPDLNELTFSGTYKDKELLRVDLTRADYLALGLGNLEERIGQLHGRAFLELATGHGSDKSVAKANTTRIAKEYKAVLAKLKGKVKVDPSLR